MKLKTLLTISLLTFSCYSLQAQDRSVKTDAKLAEALKSKPVVIVDENEIARIFIDHINSGNNPFSDSPKIVSLKESNKLAKSYEKEAAIFVRFVFTSKKSDFSRVRVLFSNKYDATATGMNDFSVASGMAVSKETFSLMIIEWLRQFQKNQYNPKNQYMRSPTLAKQVNSEIANRTLIIAQKYVDLRFVKKGQIAKDTDGKVTVKYSNGTLKGGKLEFDSFEVVSDEEYNRIIKSKDPKYAIYFTSEKVGDSGASWILDNSDWSFECSGIALSF